MPYESEIIEMIRGRSKAGPGFGIELGIGDDSAVLRTDPGTDLLFCSDLSVEGVHLRTEWAGPELIGRKALAVTVSDIAAMGGEPKFALASVALPHGVSMQFVEQLFLGMFDVAESLGLSIVGGDTSASPGGIFIDTSVIGICRRGRAITRSGATPGDVVYVTGDLGGSALGLSLLMQGFRLGVAGDEPADQASRARQAAIRRHLMPAPQVRAGRLIGLEGLATALIDISDGLATDLAHLAQESKCGAVIDASLLPVAQPARDLMSTSHSTDLVDLALTSGEEYELLFCSPPQHSVRIRDMAENLELPITRIGEVTDESGLFIVLDGKTLPMTASGFEHEI
jgi:thiamine-monophosphate kinase